jgi:Spy/CpxP family protein refolding chaperone
MKRRLVLVPLMMAAVLLAQPPAGGRQGGAGGDFSQRLENMLTKFLSLDATQQNQVHTILADAQVQSKGSADQLKTLRASLKDAIKTNNTAQIDALTLQISQMQQPLDATRSKAAARIYAILTPEQQNKLGDGLGMLLGGGFGPRMRPEGRPPQH